MEVNPLEPYYGTTRTLEIINLLILLNIYFKEQQKMAIFIIFSLKSDEHGLGYANLNFSASPGLGLDSHPGLGVNYPYVIGNFHHYRVGRRHRCRNG